jgi:hypothetical protein
MERGRMEAHMRRIEAGEFNIRHMATCRTYVKEGARRVGSRICFRQGKDAVPLRPGKRKSSKNEALEIRCMVELIQE